MHPGREQQFLTDRVDRQNRLFDTSGFGSYCASTLYALTGSDTAVLVQQPGMPPQMMNGMHPQQMHASLQSMMQPNRGMPQRPREGPEGEPAPKRPRVNLGSNQGTSLLEAFNADEIKTHLTMLRSRPGETLPAFFLHRRSDACSLHSLYRRITACTLTSHYCASCDISRCMVVT